MDKLSPEKALENTRSLIEFQLSKVEMEVRDRERLSRKILEKLQKELNGYISAKNHPIERYEYATGISPFEDEERLRNLVRETKHNIRVEEKSCWNDVQRLEWERRQLQRERAQIIFSLKLLQQNKGDWLTPYQARRVLKSIVYRRKLLDDLPDLEVQLSRYVQSTGTHYLGGYEISFENGYLRLKECESLKWRQLKLHLDDAL